MQTDRSSSVEYDITLEEVKALSTNKRSANLRQRVKSGMMAAGLLIAGLLAEGCRTLALHQVDCRQTLSAHDMR